MPTTAPPRATNPRTWCSSCIRSLPPVRLGRPTRPAGDLGIDLVGAGLVRDGSEAARWGTVGGRGGDQRARRCRRAPALEWLAAHGRSRVALGRAAPGRWTP